MMLRQMILFLPWVIRANFVQAEVVPHDLQKLLDQYHYLEKTEKSQSVISHPQILSLESELPVGKQLSEEIERLVEENSQPILEVHVEQSPLMSRQWLLKKIYAQGVQTLYPFCSAFPQRLLVNKDKEELSEEDFQEKQKKQDILHCRKALQSMFGGIFFADPKIYIFTFDFNDDKQTRHLVIYLQSLVDPSTYLRYQLSQR